MQCPDPVRMKKLERLASGGRPRVLDLFAGCGGLSLGFQRAGFEILAAVEMDPHAARSHAINFHPGDRFDLHAKPRDISQEQPDQVLGELYPGERAEDLVDIIIGGPPCQAYARVGRAKLREIWRHPEGYKLDPRGDLFLRYLYYVDRLKPVALVMENVPDALNYGGHNIAQEVADWLEDRNYVCRYTLLNAVHYGVPQMRERMFLIAVAGELGVEPEFPVPTHAFTLPAGYKNARKVAMRTLGLLQPERLGSFVSPPTVDPALPPAVTAYEAIGDLPPITAHLENRIGRGPRRFTEQVPYAGPPHSDYARLMRTWPGFEALHGISDHVIRYLPRDYRIFARMRPGDQYPEAYAHALSLFMAAVERLRREGVDIAPGSEPYQRLWKEYVPPYDVSKFPNRWWKMERDLPVRTLMAHLGKDSYTHIHYDDAQARTISVREAARLQSFPDGFRFAGTMNPAFRQIGNAVPPLLAWRVGAAVREAIETALGVRLPDRP